MRECYVKRVKGVSYDPAPLPPAPPFQGQKRSFTGDVGEFHSLKRTQPRPEEYGTPRYAGFLKERVRQREEESLNASNEGGCKRLTTTTPSVPSGEATFDYRMERELFEEQASVQKEFGIVPQKEEVTFSDNYMLMFA
jgi:hypothetical protein